MVVVEDADLGFELGHFLGAKLGVEDLVCVFELGAGLEDAHSGTTFDLCGGAPKRLSAAARFQLDPKLPPGDYFLQVVVTDKLAKENSRTASGWMDFEILGATP